MSILIDQLETTLARLSDNVSASRPSETEKNGDKSLIRTYAPKGLEEPFQQLCSVLHPCLSRQRSSGAAILLGPRGSGKSLVLDRCLAACNHATLRLVHVHGILCRGSHVPRVIYEIIRQLSDMAIETTDGKSTRRTQRDKHLLRLRRSNFTSNLALLESILKLAQVDQNPIVMVLDELEAFVSEPLLLYFLLDRVATPGSNLVLIAKTANPTALLQLEKRIRSRAEGTAKVIYMTPSKSYEDLVTHVLEEYLSTAPHRLRERMAKLLRGPASNPIEVRILETLQREFRMGKDARWFCRILSSALSLYRLKCMLYDGPAPFSTQFMVDALVCMGAGLSDASSATRQTSFPMVNGRAVYLRHQALLDLSPPQVGLLLAARRILTRETIKDAIDAPPLTLQRIWKEYQTTFSKNTTAITPAVEMAGHDLIYMGLLQPSMTHSGGGPLQYQGKAFIASLDNFSLARLPLHLPLETQQELGQALKMGVLNGATALLEWGKKQN